MGQAEPLVRPKFAQLRLVRCTWPLCFSFTHNLEPQTFQLGANRVNYATRCMRRSRYLTKLMLISGIKYRLGIIIFTSVQNKISSSAAEFILLQKLVPTAEVVLVEGLYHSIPIRNL